MKDATSVERGDIGAWAEEARGKYRFCAEVMAVEEAADRTLLAAHLTGDLPGNPVDLRYRFKLTLRSWRWRSTDRSGVEYDR
jgi:hypothetical protein